MSSNLSILALSLYHHTEEMEGIARFAREAGWALRFVICSAETIPKNRKFDGMLLIHPYESDEMKGFIAESQIPKVMIGRPPHNYPLPYVWYDLEQAMNMAVEYFIARSYKHIGLIEHVRYIDLYKTIKGQISDAGCESVIFNAKKLLTQLAKAPKPLAIIAVDDDWARDIYMICEDLGLQVPEQVAILGTSNTRYICEFNIVPLSSVATQVSDCAYLAAQKLQEMMNGETVSSELLPPQEIAVRESTALPAIADLRVAKALKILQKNFHQPMTIESVATECGLNRYSLDLLFKTELNYTMKGYLQNLRMLEAERLLIKGDLAINEIASAVSYKNHVSFLRAFQNCHNCSPSEFRKRQTHEE